jgi:hypothetical protein
MQHHRRIVAERDAASREVNAFGVRPQRRQRRRFLVVWPDALTYDRAIVHAARRRAYDRIVLAVVADLMIAGLVPFSFPGLSRDLAAVRDLGRWRDWHNSKLPLSVAALADGVLRHPGAGRRAISEDGHSGKGNHGDNHRN